MCLRQNLKLYIIVTQQKNRKSPKIVLKSLDSMKSAPSQPKVSPELAQCQFEVGPILGQNRPEVGPELGQIKTKMYGFSQSAPRQKFQMARMAPPWKVSLDQIQAAVTWTCQGFKN